MRMNIFIIRIIKKVSKIGEIASIIAKFLKLSDVKINTTVLDDLLLF